MSKIVLVSALELEHGDSKDLFGVPIHITGLGKIAAASKMTEIICLEKPGLVINFGSCGNLKTHKVGDVLKVGKVHNNIDCRPMADYGVTPFTNIGPIVIDEESDINCFTTDQFFHQDKVHEYTPKYNEMTRSCNIVDMECYALAHTCLKYNIAFHSYKWVSDDGESLDWRTNAAIGFENFKSLFKEKYL